MLLAAAARARGRAETAVECARRAYAVAVAAGLTLLADRALLMLMALDQHRSG